MTTMPLSPVSTDDLHAWVDGQLDADRAVHVLAWLQSHPEDAARVADWQAQRLALRRLAAEASAEDLPAALTAIVHRSRHESGGLPVWAQALAAGVLLAAGLVIGHGWGRSEAVLASAPSFVRDAGIAHAVYTPEKRHPVEVSADDEAHLVQWLSRRLGTALKVPVLSGQGYRLLGGRLLPGEGSPRAQFMYEEAGGARLTLYITVFEPGHAPVETAFRSVREGNRQSHYWVDERFGYALSAPVQAPRVAAIAQEVYRQLAPHGGPLH